MSEENLKELKHINKESIQKWRQEYQGGNKGAWYRSIADTEKVNTKARFLKIGEVMRNEPREVLSRLVQMAAILRPWSTYLKSAQNTPKGEINPKSPRQTWTQSSY